MRSHLDYLMVCVVVVGMYTVLGDDIGKKERTEIHRKLLNDETIDLEELMQEYLKVCPFSEPCMDRNSSTFVSRSNSTDLMCPDCSCQPDCVLNNKCCPSVIYGYLEYECVNVLARTDNDWRRISYHMIASCPDNSLDTGESIFDESDDVPVVSLATGVTYKTRYFANCNADDKSLVMWNATIHCSESDGEYWDPQVVEINTFEDLIQNIRDLNCFIRYSVTNDNVPHASPCEGDEHFLRKEYSINKNVSITACNETGLWDIYYSAIDLACRRLTLPYAQNDIYKNVFCYICNPGLSFLYHNSKPVISACNITGRWRDYDTDTEHYCLNSTQTTYAFPFKNIFCKLCNMDWNDIAIPDGNDTWVRISTLQDKNVFDLIGNIFQSQLTEFETKYYSNISDVNITLEWEIDYAGHARLCSLPLYIRDTELQCSKLRSDCYTVVDEDSGCGQEHIRVNRPVYDCTDKFRKSVLVRDMNLDTYNSNLYDDDFLLNYILELYFCDDSFFANSQCSTNCSIDVLAGHNIRNIGCLFCLSGNVYDFSDWRLWGFDIVMKISCLNILESWLFVDVFSLLEAARDSPNCSIQYIPTGVTDVSFLNQLLETDACIDFPFIDQVTCINSDTEYYIGSYRRLFTVPNNDWKELLKVPQLMPTEMVWCDGTFDYSTNETDELCRTLFCSEGHFLINDTCKSEHETYARMLYELRYRFVLINLATSSELSNLRCVDNQDIVGTNISDICKGLQGAIVDVIGELSTYAFQECSLAIDKECSDEYMVETVEDHQVEVSLKVMIEFTNRLTEVENYLVESLSQSIDILTGDSCSMRLSQSALTDDVLRTKCTYHSYDIYNATFGHKLVYVNKLLTCPQIELFDWEYAIDNTSGILQFTLSEQILSIDDYIVKEDGRVRVCLKYIKVPALSTTLISVTDIQIIYKLVDNVFSIASLFCLFITFATYCIFASIRTIPGMNTMSLIFSLFWAQLTLKFGIWQPTDSTLCPAFGVLVHFFWLATFCSMNICSVHMYHVFSSNQLSLPTFSKRRLVAYFMYTYVSPLGVVVATAAIHLALSKGASFGYGQTICFLTDSVTTIIAFICPCVFIYLTNIAFFVMTYVSIRRSLSVSMVRNSVERRHYLIYIRLWTLLGITWPLLIVDAMLELSVFSFIALSFNTLQGVFIFISFVCNKRVLGMYRVWLCKGRKNGIDTGFVASVGHLDNYQGDGGSGSG